MSLNGLDDAKVREAHEAAASEPGGWFLLKYATRDEVELLGRGNGGIVEIRNNIAQYEEKSPLYGFLRYRRRNVLIKYLPEGCSRLIQARVTVHFSSVCDQFAPCDTTFEITTPKELKDTTLSAACSLHAASGSTSSSTSSLRRRRLMEIAEEEEEEQRAAKRQSVVLEEGLSATVDAEDADLPSPSSQEPTSPVRLSAELAASPKESQFAGSTDTTPTFVGVPRPNSPAQSMDDARRLSSQTARTDLYSYSSFSSYGKPKVKLGPRPSLDVSGRPHTAGNCRPTSAMPAGFKLFSKGSKNGKSGQKGAEVDDIPNEQDEIAEITFAATSIPFPETTTFTDSDPILAAVRPHTSSGEPANIQSSSISTKSGMPSISVPASRHNTMTPEKARLMKAMQLREKKKKMSMQPSPTPQPAVDGPQETATKETAESAEPSDELAPAKPDTLGKFDGSDLEKRLSMSKADSGIVLDVSSSAASILAESASVDTQPESHPASPVITSSEIDDSTKASSLSESTDETVQEAPDGKSEERHEDSEPGIPGKEEEEVVLGRVDTREAGIALEEHQETNTQPVLENGALDTSSSVPISRFSSIGSGGQKSPDVVQSVEVDAHANHAELETKRDNAVATPTEVKIPVSKFSTQGSPRSPDIPSIFPPPDEPIDVPGDEEAKTLDRTVPKDADSISIETRRSKRHAIEPIRTDLIGRERPVSDANLSDDEALMEELQSATVEEAMPMTVAKSPATPVFPTGSPPKQLYTNGDAVPRTVRTVSNPARGGLLTPSDASQSSARAVSSGAAFLHKITQQNSSSSLASKKSHIGSSISQRIKALEKLSGSKEGDEESSRNAPSSTFFSVRKTSVREPSRSPSVVDRATSLTRQTPSPPGSRGARDASPDPSKLMPRERSRSVASRLSVFEGGSAPRGRPESVQVTARIIRDPSQSFPKAPEQKLGDPVEFTPLELRESPLIVDHQRATPPTEAEPHISPVVPEPTKETIQERRKSRDKRRSGSNDRNADEKSRRRSLSIVKDFIKDRRNSLAGGKSPSIDNLTLASPVAATPSRSPSSRPPSTHQNAPSFTRRLSISSRRSRTSFDGMSGMANMANPLSPSSTTEGSQGSADDNRSEKKKSRASRFMRRLSSSLSISRGKNITPTNLSPTVAEEDDMPVEERPPPGTSASSVNNLGVSLMSGAASHAGTSSPINITAYLGDVNVQFPDNLLWKRRTMCLDASGFLILSALPLGKDKAVGAGVKRYHMSEFRSPYVPDLEVQELPNSVCLDFIDGSALQFACEDRSGQLNVLHVLQDAHRGHTSFGQ